jgi:hypothetical protein
VNNYKLYPNPVNNELKIDFKVTDDYEVKLLDVKGKLLFNKQFNDVNKAFINTAELPKGSYIIQIKTAANVFNHRIVK